MPVSLDQLFRSWSLSSHLHELPPGTDSSTIAEFERLAGWNLPDDWRQLYAHSNGASLFHGNLNLYPLLGSDRSILVSSETHREANWPIPRELWIAGDNGQGDKFGLWVPPNDSPRRPIVALGQIIESGCMAIAGSCLTGFLLLQTAFYLQVCEGPTVAMDAIALPHELRTDDPDDITWASIDGRMG